MKTDRTNADRTEWALAIRAFVSAWEKDHQDILPVGSNITITINPADPDNPTRYMTSTCSHVPDFKPARSYTRRRTVLQKIFGITPEFPWKEE